MMLSCLADADHTDTAVFYSQAPDREEIPQLRANERLAALDQYVLTLGSNDIRSRLRREMYLTCRDANTTGKFTACDSPVGSVKTTAVMAQKSEAGFRHSALYQHYPAICRCVSKSAGAAGRESGVSCFRVALPGRFPGSGYAISDFLVAHTCHRNNGGRLF